MKHSRLTSICNIRTSNPLHWIFHLSKGCHGEACSKVGQLLLNPAEECTTGSHPHRLDVVSCMYSEDICSVNSKVEAKKTWNVISRYFKIHFACQLKEQRNHFLYKNQPAKFGSMDSGYSLYSVPETCLETVHILQTLFALREQFNNRSLMFKQLIRSELLHSLDQGSFCKPHNLVSCLNLVYCHVNK